MSARVFKPITFADVPKIRSSSTVEGSYVYKGIAKVRRSLFNPDPVETKRFLKEEFAKLAKNDREKWDFDFVAGKPKDIVNRYEWTLITEKNNPSTPVKKQLLHSQESYDAFLYAPIPTSSATLSDDQLEEFFEEIMVTDTVQHSPTSTMPKKQSLITDFMQTRKRIDESSFKKKMENMSTPRPMKIARMSFTDSAS